MAKRNGPFDQLRDCVKLRTGPFDQAQGRLFDCAQGKQLGSAPSAISLLATLLGRLLGHCLPIAWRPEAMNRQVHRKVLTNHAL